MYKYFIAFYISLAISFFTTPIIKEIVVKLKLFDIPDHRKIHSGAMPKMGGIAFFISFYITILILWKLNYNDIELHGFHKEMLGIIVGGIILFVLGIYDDIVGANAYNKFFIHILVGVILMICNIKVQKIAIPFSDQVFHLPFLLSAFFTISWIIAVINIMNLIDGMDGLSSGIAIISSFVFLLISIIKGNIFVILLSLAFLGSVIGFIKYNFPPAQIFMGDVGSMFLGFMISIFAIITLLEELNIVNITVSFLALAVPIADTSWAIIRRIKNKRSIFDADKGHFHHKLLELGYSQKKAVIIIYEISCFLGIIAVLISCIYYI